MDRQELLNELIIANKELAFQNEEKKKRAAELILANEEILAQNKEIATQNEAFLRIDEELSHTISELLIAKVRAEESDRLKSAFLANMSHEIRTPLNSILGFSELLEESDLSDAAKSKCIRIIQVSGARLLNIINNILNISKIQLGQMEVTISEININEQIEFIYTLFKPEAEQKGLQISFNNSLPAREAFIKTDVEKILTILNNLVKNAIKFSDAGTIDFGYVKKDDFLEFFVKDTGKGIREELEMIIFDRFRQ